MKPDFQVELPQGQRTIYSSVPIGNYFADMDGIVYKKLSKGKIRKARESKEIRQLKAKWIVADLGQTLF